MAHAFFRNIFSLFFSNSSQHTPFPRFFSETICCQSRFPLRDSGNSSLFQFTISGNACYRKIFNVTVSSMLDA